MSVVNPGVKDFRDFEFQFIVNNDWHGWGLKAIGNWIQSFWFQHRDVEYWVYSTETVCKSESDRMGAWKCKDFIWSKEFIRKFLEGHVIWKNLALTCMWLPILNSGAGSCW